MDFTASQQSAIGFDLANLQLIACAGSGKTEVVARRVVHLLSPGVGGLAPRNIMAFIFTEKAAAEKCFANNERVMASFGQLAELRNSIRHSRTVDEITRKEGEAAILWFGQVLQQ